ncbi:MAG: hypothetical protein KatS3mg033_1433 [Thermonema sp.]|uniref:hypothetical protein n=1 Tax=Thermonema sp. TaxID=2231181 RepID=UPI0021DEB90C|nr:hypothetical protein [Thermonema sp.]GIV39633.1 MAG: hypothetical protein KatS3mg033_1433 [Thermonema sp.]
MNNLKTSLMNAGMSCLAVAGMVILHLYYAPGFHLPDYDAHRYAWNAQQLATGHFNELFHHLAPLYQLILAAVWRLFASIEAWIVLTAGLYALISVYWCFQVACSRWQRLSLFVLLQFTPLLFYHNGGIQTTAFFLLGFTVWWRLYKNRSNRLLPTLAEALWWGICLTLEYKSIFWLTGLWLHDGYRLMTGRHHGHLICYLRQGVHMLWVPFLLMFTGALQGIPWWRYPAAWVALFFRKDYLRQASSLDILFHFKYLLQYEPLALAGVLLLLFWWLRLKDIPSQRQESILYFLALWLLLLMSFLPKAPRGILLSVFIAYVALVQLMTHMLASRVLLRSLLMGLGVGWACWVSTQRLLPYATFHAPYKEAAQRLVSYTKGKGEIHSALALATALYLPPDVRLHVHFHQALAYRPLLVSDAALLFYPEAQLQKLRKQAIWVLPHPFLGFPLLHLESAEFQGHSYEEALTFAKRMQRHAPALYFLPH